MNIVIYHLSVNKIYNLKLDGSGRIHIRKITSLCIVGIFKKFKYSLLLYSVCPKILPFWRLWKHSNQIVELFPLICLDLSRKAIENKYIHVNLKVSKL